MWIKLRFTLSGYTDGLKIEGICQKTYSYIFESTIPTVGCCCLSLSIGYLPLPCWSLLDHIWHIMSRAFFILVKYFSEEKVVSFLYNFLTFFTWIQVISCHLERSHHNVHTVQSMHHIHFHWWGLVLVQSAASVPVVR